MGFSIDDPGTGEGAGVENRRLLTDARTGNRAAFVSIDQNRAFNAVFPDASAVAGDYVAYLKNTSSTRDLIVDVVRVGAVNAALWKVFAVTGTGAGTAVTARNMNLGSGLQPEATILADNITGLATDGEIARKRTAAALDADIHFDDVLVLSPNTAIAIEYDTGTTGGAEVTMRFYYEDVA